MTNEKDPDCKSCGVAWTGHDGAEKLCRHRSKGNVWLNLPTPSSTCAPEPECSESPSKSPSKRSESEPTLLAVVSGKPVPRPRSWRGWKTRKAAACLFGTMQPPSSAGGAEDWNVWMQSRQGILASPSRTLASVMAQRMLDTFGPQSVGALQDSNLNSCFSRTSTATSVLGCGKSCGISKDSATALRRACSARRKWARRIFANGCLFSGWQTASTLDGQGRAYTRDAGKKGAERLSLEGEARGWATPRASSNGSDSGSAQRQKDGPNPGLKDQARGWATPTGRDWKVGDLPTRQGTQVAACHPSKPVRDGPVRCLRRHDGFLARWYVRDLLGLCRENGG